MSEDVDWKKYWAEEKNKTKKQKQAEKEANKMSSKNGWQAGRELRESAKKQKQAEKAEELYSATPAGRAKNAYQQGQKYFQVSIPVDNVGRDALAILGHSMVTKVREVGDAIGIILGDIESEGWTLMQAGFAFRQTRQDSRDKFLASGQQIAISGETVGVYLFKRK